MTSRRLGGIRTKKKMKSKLIAAVMTLAMAFTMMPVMGTPVYADDPNRSAPDAITLGTEVLNQNVNQDEGMQKVFYGSNNETAQRNTPTRRA